MVVTGIGTRRVTDEKSLPRELEQLKAGGRVLVHVIYVQSMGIINIQRGGSVLLTAR
jgi:hypothetical protein